MMLKTYYKLLLITILSVPAACNREDLLHTNPSSDMRIPSTLESMQNLLDKDMIMCETPVLGELSADNYRLTDTYWQTLNTRERNSYVWAKDIFEGEGNVADWDISYTQVLYANQVLYGLEKIPVTSQNEQQYMSIKGAALFIRAYAFYNVAQVFAPVYDANTADIDLGIPLRLTPNLDEKSVRSTLRQSYDRILEDLYEAAYLLPEGIDIKYRNRPSRPAAMALLARVCLSMRAYTRAGAYADSSLRLYDILIDYNTINVSAINPFSRLNNETLYQSRLISTSNVLKAGVMDCVVDSVLYGLYDFNDLRREVFFMTNPAGLLNIKGSYNGTIFPFSGPATDEMFLIRAECLARAGNTTAAMDDLNTLLQKRWKKGTFIPVTAISAGEALQRVLVERRKELPFRGLRWTDIRRLNKEGPSIIPTRFIQGKYDQLQPNDLRYVLPIPPDVIALSGMRQNPR